MISRILVAGGYGVVGSNAARLLRKAGFEGRLGIAGRNPERGEPLAREIGAQCHYLNNSDQASITAVLDEYDLILAVLKDPKGHLLDGALARGIGFVGITQSPDTVAPMLFRVRSASSGSPVVTLGHWQAGMATSAARMLARRFKTVSDIRIAALYDRADPMGTMATEDTGEYMSRALIRENGLWLWVEARPAVRTVERHGAEPFQAIPMGVLDTVSLGAVTGARNVRFDIGVGQSKGSAAGGRASHEVHFELDGIGHDGQQLEVRAVLSDPEGQAHLTGIGLVAVAQALVDAGESQTSGWQLPETLIDPERALDLAARFGATLRESAPEGDAERRSDFANAATPLPEMQG
ncbi:MAG TPA: hypothetical protein VF680_07540 [Allosphingosinicella sp.]